jgi:uncharacterized protein
MPEEPLWRPGRLRELGEEECRDLLGSRSVGRVAFVDAAGPTVLPVNFVMVEDALVFRTSPHNEMARHLDGRQVAFEVDHVDDFTQSGWSVLVRGTSRFVESPEDLPGSARPSAWPEGVRSLFVRIDIGSLSGRRLLGS